MIVLTLAWSPSGTLGVGRRDGHHRPGCALTAQVLLDGAERHRAIANRGSDAADGTGPNVTRGEHPGQARLQGER